MLLLFKSVFNCALFLRILIMFLIFNIDCAYAENFEQYKLFNTVSIKRNDSYQKQRKLLLSGINDSYFQTDNAVKYLNFLKSAVFNEKLKSVNDFWNKLRYVDDIINYGVQDYWALPSEFMRKKSGDCEDFAVAKYLTLRKLGIEPSEMRILTGFSDKNLPHAIVAVWEPDNNQNIFILDSNNTKIQTEQSMKNKFLPKFSLNENFAWAHIVIGSYRETAKKIFPVAYRE